MPRVTSGRPYKARQGRKGPDRREMTQSRVAPLSPSAIPRRKQMGLRMDHFLYKNGTLHAEDVALTDIAAAVGTPFLLLFGGHADPALCAVQ